MGGRTCSSAEKRMGEQGCLNEFAEEQEWDVRNEKF